MIRSAASFEIVLDGLQMQVAASVRRSNSAWLLCLHGIQSNKALFDGIFEQAFAAGFSVIAMDLIGFGKSSKPYEFSYDIQDQASVVAEVMRRLDVQNLNIIGHSVGGMIGTLLLKPLDDIVRSFVNMEGNLVSSDCGLIKEVTECPFSEFRTRKFEHIKSSLRNASTPGSLDRAVWLEDVPDFAFYRTCQSIVQWSATDELLPMFTDAHCRKLLVCSSENSHMGARVAGVAEVAEIPSSGHFMLQDDPKTCYRHITEFLTA